MSKKLSIGVIGLGLMGQKHLSVYNEISGIKLKSVCDKSKDKVDYYSEKYKVTGYQSFNDMLQDNELDAVSICTPDNLHLDVVKTAIQYNKHILVEKPIAYSLKDGKMIIELTKNYEKIFMVGHILRFDSRFTQAKKYIQDGKIGDIIHINSRRNSPITGPLHYKGFSNISHHVMIHDIDIINWLVNSKPIKIFAKSRELRLKDHQMTDTILSIIEYSNGSLASVEACWALPENSPLSIDDKMEIVGSRGVIYIDSCDKGLNLVTESEITYPDSRHFPEVNSHISGDLFEEINSFINYIYNNRKPLFSAEEAFLALEVADAIDKSINLGREISLI